MDNIIELSFDKALTILAGFDFGESVYNEQVKGKVDLNRDIHIVFPD